MVKVLPHSLAMSQQWEIAKGHLRAMTAMAGSVSSGESERPYRFERIGDRIESFIKDFEADGFHEGKD